MKLIEASLKSVKGSHYKFDDVANLIRGLSVKNADSQLQFCNRRAAAVMLKLLRSCVANAVHNDNLSMDELFVHRVNVGKAFVLKRFMPRGRGRSTRIEKRFTKITIILSNSIDNNKKVINK
jgi:large subunit ribosomal protein L22